MQPRSSLRLISNPSSNPTSSMNLNPKGRNRRCSKQRIENLNLDDLSPPVVTMADQRTMAQLLQAPTEGYEDVIFVPAIAADNFKLKHGLLTLVQNKQFFRHDKEDPHAHVRYFNKITSTLKFPCSKYFFPPSKTTNLHNEITNFQQRFDESFAEAWDRFKDLLRACPHHGFSELHQLDTFYNALNSKYQDSLNSAAGGIFLDKMPHECLAIIESKSKVRYSHNKPVVSKVSTNASTSSVSPDFAELKDMVKALLLDKKSQNQSPALVKAVEESCVTCGGAHSYRNCPATDGNNYRDNIQEFLSQASALIRLLPIKLRLLQTQGVSKEDFSPYVKANDAVLRNMQTQGQNMQNQLTNITDLITKFVNSNSASTSSSGTLPSITIANPKSDLKAITTQSGVSYDGPQILPPPYSLPKVVENEPYKLPEKLGDPGKFLIPCDFPGMVECLALADLDASINLMPFSVWKRLSLSDLTPMCMTLELADHSISRLVGVAEDVYVKVGSFHFPSDFVVVDFDSDPRVPLILGRSFLKTERALIDVFKGELTLRVGKEAITFNLDQTSRYSANYSDMTAKRIDVIYMACEEYSHDVFGFSDTISSGNPTPYYDPIIFATSPTLTITPRVFSNTPLTHILLRAILGVLHKAYWALKHVNFELKTMGDHQKLQLNELNELRDQSYKNSLIYKEKTKKLHESKIKNRIFNVGDRVLPFNSRLKELEAPMEDQPLPTDALPIALLPGYIDDSNPEEDEEDPEEDPETMITVNQGMSIEEIELVVAQRVANAIEAIAIYEMKTNIALKSMSQTERQKETVAENASNKRKWESNHNGSLSQQKKGHKVASDDLRGVIFVIYLIFAHSRLRIVLNFIKSAKSRANSTQESKPDQEARFFKNKYTMKLNLSKFQSLRIISSQRSKTNSPNANSKTPGTYCVNFLKFVRRTEVAKRSKFKDSTCLGLRMISCLSLKNDMPLQDKFIIDDPNITMEEYIRLEDVKAQRHGQTFNWETATHGKMEYCKEDEDSLTNFETEYPAIVFDDTFDAELSCEPTVSPLNENEIDFIISFVKSDDEDYMNDKVNTPSSPEPTISHSKDLDFFKDFEIEFLAITYNDGLTSKLTKPSASFQHIKEFDLIWHLYHLGIRDTHGSDFAGLTEGMRQTLSDRLRMVYTRDDRHELFTSHAWRRLFEIRAPLVREFILKFLSTCRMSDTEIGLHTDEEMAEDGFGAYWLGSERVIPDKGDLRDYWIEISSNRDFLAPAPSYVTDVDLFYLRSMDRGTTNVSYLLVQCLFRHAEGRNSCARLFMGYSIGCLAAHSGLAWVAPRPERQSNAAAGVPGAAEDASIVNEGAQADPAPTQAPQPPPPSPRTIPQRIARLEEEVQELRQSTVGLREDVDRSIIDQGRFTTWMVSCMTQLVDTSGRTYQAFDNALVGSSQLPYQRRTRHRTSDASTSAP
nr:reverse transcriptase domain-containing protein [Tanacetum cinerariifolium]